MKIFGKEIRFLLSMKARFQIDEIDKSTPTMQHIIKTAVIMSEAYNERKRFLGEEPCDAITEDELMLINPGEFDALCAEINAATTEGMKVTVEAESGKKKQGK